jgi:hypothetical protein
VKLNTSKLAAVVLGGLAAIWFVLLFVGLPFLYGRKVDALVGQPEAVVRRELGPPTREWSASEFQCDPTLPCQQVPQGGPVFLYAEKSGAQGWYLYFDGQQVLRALEKSKAP